MRFFFFFYIWWFKIEYRRKNVVMCKENRNKSRAHRQKNMSRDINQCQLDENARVRDDRKSGPGERRQSKVLCKTRLILLSVCQAVLIWPGLHRDKVLVMNLSKRIRGTWRWGWGGGEQEGKGGGKGGECTWASVGLAAPESISSKGARILGIEILPGGK